MKSRVVRITLTGLVGLLLPFLSIAQDGGGAADSVKSLHKVLEQLYQEMIPMCGELIGVGRAIAGFAALWYIAYRVWGHLARAEPIDFYPLFKPFCLGFIVMNFGYFISMIDAVMKPTVTGTQAMVDKTDAAVAALLKQKEEAIKGTDPWKMYVGPTGEGDRDKWYKYTHPDEDPADEGWLESVGNDVRFAFAKAGYNFRNAIKEVIAEVLQLLFAAVSLCINTMRTFNLIILAILGPLAIAISVFDGFSFTLKYWVARFLNVFLWLPVCNIFGAVIGKIQENMLKLDLSQIHQTGDTFFSRTDMGYFVFLIIGIYGYTTVPSIADHIVKVGGGDALTGRMTRTMGQAGAMAGQGAMMAGGAALGAGSTALSGINNLAHAPGDVMTGYNSGSTGKGFAAGAGRAYGKFSNYLKDKLSGNG